MKNGPKTLRPAWVPALAAALILAPACVKKPLAPPAEAPAVTDAESLIQAVSRRAGAVERLDAVLEMRLQGEGAPYRGRYFGTVRIESRPGKDFAVRLQAYTVVGVPVLEVTVKGGHLVVFSPLENAVYLNFRDPAAGPDPEEFPLSSFEQVALPVGLLVEQMELLFGRGFSDRRRYDLAPAASSHLLSEWSNGVLRREIEYSGQNLFLTRVRVYRGGVLVGAMECEGHDPQDPVAGFIPRKLVLARDDLTVTLKLSNLAINRQASDVDIELKLPRAQRYVLLTPPVP